MNSNVASIASVLVISLYFHLENCQTGKQWHQLETVVVVNTNENSKKVYHCKVVNKWQPLKSGQ